MLGFTNMTSKMVRGELFLKGRHTATRTRPRARTIPEVRAGNPARTDAGQHGAEIGSAEVGHATQNGHNHLYREAATSKHFSSSPSSNVI